MIHRIFSVKQLSDPFLNEWLKYFQSMCFIFHMTICIFIPKNRDEGDMMGWDIREVHGHSFA